MQQRAFSLVELSIVLVILGLLTGGILAGQSLIRASELRSVITEYNQWSTSAHSCRDKYFALPGDMTNATSFWGDNATYCASAATPNGSTCNGDGDGKIIDGAVNNISSEGYQFWNHLALAGLIAGTYTGITDPAGPAFSTFANSPRSKLALGGWNIRYRTAADVTGNPTVFLFKPELHYLQLGQVNTGAFGGSFIRPLMAAAEAWNVDTKVDDGRPGQGKLVAFFWATCTTATSVNDFNGNYRLSDTSSNLCSLGFINPY